MRRSLRFLGFKALFFYLCPSDLKILFLLLFPMDVTLELSPLLSGGSYQRSPKTFSLPAVKVISPENHLVVLLESS